MDSKKLITLALLISGCPADDDDGNDTNNDSGSEEAGSETGACEPMTANVPQPNEGACGPLATDYTPGADDDFPACGNDNGTWTVILEEPPAAATRVEAFETIRMLLRGGTTPSPDDFVAARMTYALEEGIESRVVRREDLHYPEIDAADQMAGVDFDKQCSVASNVAKYPDRCVGPAKIAPIINEAFDAGMAGEGDANVHAARLEAAMAWFFYVSSYKEASSCVRFPEDCDAQHGYYDGDRPRESPIGIAKDVNDISPLAHIAIEDGIYGIGCWRDLQRDAVLWEDFTPDEQQLFLQVHEQQDNALHYGFARIVRDRLEKHPMACGSEADASWAYIQIAGAVLDHEAGERDATNAAILSALWTNDAPTLADIEAGINALDAVFPCPQCPSCEVPTTWGYDPIE